MIESGYICPIAGQACLEICGDGKLISSQLECDDNNLLNNDGCDQNCEIELGWICIGKTPSTCYEKCGDGLLVSGKHQCDDGNTRSGN